MPEPRNTPERPSITDPARIRALAHPIRIALLEYLGEVPEATVTECAEHLDESPASCSYHLHMLAKYGFIEPGERRGREKPWRVVSRGLDMRPDPEDAGSLRALQELAVLSIERQADRLRHFFAHADREPDAWVQASTLMGGSFWATVEELAELSRDLQQITQRFAGRSENPELRPAGARQARIFAAANPDPLPASKVSTDDHA